jgi:hypothetical protein
VFATRIHYGILMMDCLSLGALQCAGLAPTERIEAERRWGRTFSPKRELQGVWIGTLADRVPLARLPQRPLADPCGP